MTPACKCGLPEREKRGKRIHSLLQPLAGEGLALMAIMHRKRERERDRQRVSGRKAAALEGLMLTGMLPQQQQQHHHKTEALTATSDTSAAAATKWDDQTV